MATATFASSDGDTVTYCVPGVTEAELLGIVNVARMPFTLPTDIDQAARCWAMLDPASIEKEKQISGRSRRST